MPTNNNALLIFIKNPERGKVKTRLASTVGDERALEIYEALLGHTRKVALDVDVARYLYYSKFIETKDAWQTSDFQKKAQEGADLGERMSRAFEEAFQEHQAVVIIGSDCATLSDEIVEQAFYALETHDFVIGPATDGGYYLLGMRNYEPSVFKNIVWSVESVCSETVKRIEALGSSYAFLTKLSDIDYEKDWNQWGWELD